LVGAWQRLSLANPPPGIEVPSSLDRLLFQEKMVLQERIELSTSPLPRECSTTELLQRRFVGRGLVANFPPCKGNLDPFSDPL
jgi:hypothetical protein